MEENQRKKLHRRVVWTRERLRTNGTNRAEKVGIELWLIVASKYIVPFLFSRFSSNASKGCPRTADIIGREIRSKSYVTYWISLYFNKCKYNGMLIFRLALGCSLCFISMQILDFRQYFFKYLVLLVWYTHWNCELCVNEKWRLGVSDIHIAILLI